MKVYNFDSNANQPKTSPKKFSSASWKEWARNLPWTKIATWGFRVGAAGVLVIAFLFIYYSRQLPDPNRLLGRDVPESTKIYARDETLLYEVHGEFKRTLVNLEDINENLRNATLVAEDRNFYKHAGISITGLGRAVIVDIIHREKRQGGSTITQQFVKNAMLSRDKSFLRKLKEIILSIEVEARFSKDDIFKMYLNEIPYGRNAYGIEAASQTYFEKNARDLTLAQSAYLAALPQAPSYYNPTGPNFDALEARQKYILSQMKELDYITEDEYQKALEEEVVFSQIKNSIKAPHFVQYIQEQLAEKYGEQTLQEGGLKVYTTLDIKLQEIAEKAVADGAAKNTSGGGYNAALVAMDPKTGQILAMVGSKDYFGENYPKNCNPKTCLFSPNVNIATTLQQPGSSFKPYAYVTAFGRDHKYAPGSMLVDVKTDFGGGYSPNNFNLSQNGPVPVRRALAGSLNIPAVKILDLVGTENVLSTARKMGIDAEFKDCGLSLVLGGCDLTLLDHTAAYSVLANRGEKNEKTSILKVVSQEGKTLEEFKENKQRVLDEQAVYLLTNIMSDNSARAWVFGSNSALQLGDRPVAAKTGTTQDFRDGWTMGYTPSLVAGVWTGNNNNTSMRRDAVQTAGPIWNQFMKEALKDTPKENFERPSGIQEVTVDSVSGKLPSQYTPETKTELFADYSVPQDRDDLHVPMRASEQPPGNFFVGDNENADSDNNSDSDSSDESRPRTTVCKNLHSERRDRPNWERPVLAWAAATPGYCRPDGSEFENPEQDQNIEITSPSDGSTIVETPVTVSASVKGDNVSEVEFFVDGDSVGSADEAPYRVRLNSTYPNGKHTISARVTYSDGTTSSDSVSVEYAIGEENLDLTVSGGGNDFPLEMSAESSVRFGSVSFFAQSGGSAIRLGNGSLSSGGGNYIYSFTWDEQPASGSYNIYARTNSGVTSNRISITVP